MERHDTLGIDNENNDLQRISMTDKSNQRLDNLLMAVGDIPLIKLNKIGHNLKTSIYVKPEFMNPGGSIKDRMAVYILNKALSDGRIGPKTTIVEATSGNTGVAVAMFGAVYSRRVILTIPDKMSGHSTTAMLESPQGKPPPN